MAFKQKVVKPGCLGHVAGHANINAPKRVDNHAHRRSRMPNAHQPVSPCPDDHGGDLFPVCPIMRGSQIVAEGLEAKQQVIQVLYFGNGPHPP